MSLADLIASRSSSASLEGPSAAPSDRSPGVEPAPSEGPSSEEENQPTVEGSGQAPAATASSLPTKAFGVKEVETPSGLGIYYQAGPKRLYRLRHATKTKVTEVEVPSMSEVLDILEKGGLPWWGMRVGVQGVIGLYESHPEQTLIYLDAGNDVALVDGLKEHKLTVNDVRDSAGDRGQNVHDALEAWATKGVMPVSDVYPEEERGYVEGLQQFLLHSGVEAIESEVMVGSWKHKYAGRLDLIGQIPNGAEVFVHRTKKGRGDKTARIEGGRWLLDVKTSKDVYVTHFLQLEGYDLGLGESGYEPTDHRGVIHLLPDGRYELKESTKTHADFLAVRKAYDAVQK